MLEIATPGFGACVPDISSNAAAERCVISPDYCREGEHYRKASEARCHSTDDVAVGTCVSSERCAPTDKACDPGDYANPEPDKSCDVKRGVKNEEDEWTVQQEWTLYPGCRKDGVLGTTTKCILFEDECTGQTHTVISASYMFEQGYDTCKCYDVPVGICYPERFAPEDIWVGRNSQCATGPWDCDVGQNYMASGEAMLTLSTVEQEACRLCDPPTGDYSLSVPYKPEPEPKELEPAAESTSEDMEVPEVPANGVSNGGGGMEPTNNGFGVGFGTGLAAGAIIMAVLQRLFKKKQLEIESPCDNTTYRDDAPETELGSLT